MNLQYVYRYIYIWICMYTCTHATEKYIIILNNLYIIHIYIYIYTRWLLPSSSLNSDHGSINHQCYPSYTNGFTTCKPLLVEHNLRVKTWIAWCVQPLLTTGYLTQTQPINHWLLKQAVGWASLGFAMRNDWFGCKGVQWTRRKRPAGEAPSSWT